MSTRIPAGGSHRTQTLERTADTLAGGAVDQLKKAGDTIEATNDALLSATVSGMAAAMHVTDAALGGAAALKSTAEGALLATAGALVRVAEELGDLLGRGLQLLGRALISIGNVLRKLAGGAQIVVSDLEGGKAGKSLSDRLSDKGSEAFSRAAAALDKSLQSLVAAGGDVKGASQSLLQAAEGLAATAAHLGAAAALGTAAVAVDAARLAVDAAERGIDGSVRCCRARARP